MFKRKAVPVAEKLGAVAPAAPIETPVPFPVTAPPVIVVGASASARMPATASAMLTPLMETGQNPMRCTPLAKRTTGVPLEAAAIRKADNETGARSAAVGQLVSTPAPVEASFPISNPETDDPGPAVTKAPVSAAAVAIA